LYACYTRTLAHHFTFFRSLWQGGLLVILGCMLTSVRWNTINGKLSGISCLVFAANTTYATYQLDSRSFLPRPFHFYSIVLALAGLHLMFNANPMLKVAKD
jgi:hypothetical protein